MFEAHSISYQELQGAKSFQLPSQRFTRLHRQTLKPLFIWFAAGKQRFPCGRIEETLFVYREYRDDQGNQCCNCQHYPYPERLQSGDIETWLRAAMTAPLT